VAEFAVTAIGRDRPGIVAAVSRALLEIDGNIEDSQMSILRGHFAVMLIVSVPDRISAEALADHLGPVREELGLEAITCNPIDELDAVPMDPASHVVTVYGADHPGIVNAVSNALAELGVNITDLEARLTGADDNSLYTMIIEVAVGDADVTDVQAALRVVAEREAVEFSLRPLDAES
jgi:glycine cleavage system transcriptional repressor